MELVFDAHAHWDDERFDGDREERLASFVSDGVAGAVTSGADAESSRAAVRLAQAHERLYASVGVHPHEAEDALAKGTYLREIGALLEEEKVVALGEIGLDYHYDLSPRDKQRAVFDAQLSLAKEKRVPVVIHMREATQDAMDILSSYVGQVPVLIHSFSGSVETARECLDRGYVLSINGVLTFRNAKTLPDVVRYCPLERMTIETDSPYLTPVPHRGKRNESAYVRHVCEAVAAAKGISYEEAAKATRENAYAFYGIGGTV